MIKVDIPEMNGKEWCIERFTVDRMDWHSALRGRKVPIGDMFTRLMRIGGGRFGDPVMSDTPAEQQDLWEPVREATGSCLINGLGIGLLLKNILIKSDVTDVTVVEISQELLDMVSPHYNDQRVTFICCDAYEYQPPKGKRYNMVWHDIWDNICSDNLDDMDRLHKKYGRLTSWQGSWCQEQCKRV